MKNIISTFGRSVEEGIENLDTLVEYAKSSNLTSRSTDESEKTINGSFFINTIFESRRGTFLVIRRI